jgi:hypothetical protein
MLVKMKKIKISVIPFFILAFFFSLEAKSGGNGGNDKKTQSVNSIQAKSSVLIDVNNIAAYIVNNGIEFEDPYTFNKAGEYWPKPPQSVLNNPPIPNNYPTCNFAGGIWLTANYGGNSSDKRTACSYYTTEFNYGKWNANGGSLDNNDPTLPSGKPRFRVYKITQGDTIATATNYSDYIEWPFADGAPYLALQNYTNLKDSIAASPSWLYGRPVPATRNGKQLDLTGISSLSQLYSTTVTNTDGTKLPLLTPKILGDQSLWCVYRDLDPSAVSSDGARNFKGPAMHVEVQQYVFGFNSSTDALGNTFFMDFKIINRSNAVWDSTFIALWDDIDDGNGGTDLMGSDPVRKLAYCYKGTNDDTGQPFAYGVDPPAAGASFFQGPVKRGGGSLGQDTTLGVSSIVRFINGGFQNDPANVLQVSRAMRGRAQDGSAYSGLDATGHFEYTGDPEAGTGSLDVASNGGGPNDKRFLIVTGSNEGHPAGTVNSFGIDYIMNPGDTAEVVVAEIVARGANNLNSVTKFKKVADQAQGVFNANFKLPKAPPAPLVTCTQLPNQIILNWDNSRSPLIENTYNEPDLASASDPLNPDHYHFINYNVYQYSNSGAASGGGGTKVKIATFTVPGQPTTVVDTTTNSDGFTIPLNIYPGFISENYLNRTISIQRDYLSTTADTTLKNGKLYYFGVTASGYNPKAKYSKTSQTILESSLSQLIVAIPQSPLPGTVFSNSTGDLITNARYKLGDQNVSALVVDPTKLTGHAYRIKVDTTNADTLKWTLIDTTAQKTLISNSSSSALQSPIFDGFRPYIVQQPLGVATDAQGGTQYLPTANQLLRAKSVSPLNANEAQADTSRFPSNVFGGGIAYPKVTLQGVAPGTTVPINKLKKVKLVFSSKRDTAHQQFAYRYLRNVDTRGHQYIVGYSDTTTSRSKLDSLFIKNRTDGGYQDTVWVPFKAYEIDEFPAGGGSPTQRQVNVLFTETNDSAYAYGSAKTNPTDGGNGSGTAASGPYYYGSYIGRGSIDGKWNPTTNDDGGNEILFIMSSTYSATSASDPNSNLYTKTNLKTRQNLFDISYMLWLKADKWNKDSTFFTEGDSILISPNYRLDPQVNYDFSTTAVTTGNTAVAKNEVNKINVFPNPYLGTHASETSAFDRFVTFSHLPSVCTIRIYNLSGKLVQTIQHNSTSSTLERWNLTNSSNILVASGIYIAYIDTPLGSKILKIAVIQRQERLDTF